MRFAKVAIAAILVFLFQLIVVGRFAVAGAAPDIMTILVVVLVLDMDPVLAVVTGFFLGFLQDLGNASFLGMNALAKCLVAWGVARTGGGLVPESVPFRAALVFAASIVNDIVVLVVTTGFDVPLILVSFFRYSLLSALYAAAVGAVVFVLQGEIAGRMVRAGGRR